MLQTFIPVVIAYLLGSVPFALLVAKASGVDNLRQRGSGNLGATNVWRVAGPKVALWVFAGDIGKGTAAVLIAGLFSSTLISNELLAVACGFAAILGHMFPVLAGFQGGKGVNTGLGVMIVLLPFETLIALGVFMAAAATSRMVSLGSILAALTLPVALLVRSSLLDRAINQTYLAVTVVLALAIVMAHRSNIRRILSGTENRLSFGTRNKEDSNQARINE